ncbi:MAG: hypothetical protein ABIJ82_01760 [Patescibacteria group bacterium]
MAEERKNEKIEKEESVLHPPFQKKYDNIKMLIRSAFSQLEKVQNVVESMEQEDKKSYYQNIPGVEGYFDGQYLVSDDGRKTEVPGNYAAKSRLVYGDRLKVFVESEKQVFKQITKAERKKVEGILSKKEGRWYLLANEGTYRIADVAAEYNKAELNDKAYAYIPANNSNVPYAALDLVVKSSVGGKKVETPVKKVLLKPLERKVSDKPRAKAPLKKLEKTKKSEEVKEKPSKEFVDNILEKDDLR